MLPAAKILGTAAVAATVVSSSLADTSKCPEAGLAQLSVEDVQSLLADWNLDEALGTEFLDQKVDGFKLKLLSRPGAVDPARYTKAQPFDWLALREHIVDCEGTPTLPPAANRRQLGTTASANSVGLHIKKDQGGLILGSDGDVQVRRSGDGTLLLNATSSVIVNDVSIGGELYINGHVHLSSGNISAANVDDLVSSVTSLWAVVDQLTGAVDDNTDAIDSLSSNSEALTTIVSELNETVADNTACCSENTDAIDDLVDAVALLELTVNPHDERIVYSSEFDEAYDGWTFVGADIQTIECQNYTAIGGNLGTGDSVSFYLDGLPPHSSLIVDFTFLAIDSWDSEVASMFISDTLVWSQMVKHSDSEHGNVCANDWSDNFYTVSVEVEHFQETLDMVFQASINSAATDETWAIADVTVRTELDPSYTPVYFSDFDSNGAVGWTFFGGADAEVSDCAGHNILGGYGVLAKSHSVVKSISDLDDHTELVISFEFARIDSWDGEHAKLYVDDVLVWSDDFTHSTSGTSSWCGGTWNDKLIPITVRVAHDEDTAKLRFTSTLNQDSTDESWGLRSVSVYSNTPAVLIAYETNFDTVGLWEFFDADAEITTCGDYNVLGGYDVLGADAAVQLVLHDLTPHSSMTISFDFAKIDSWDTENAYVYVDDVLQWTQTFKYYDGEAMCGSSNSNWDEEFVPIEMTFDHFAQGIKIYVTTDLSSGATDESWGLANFKITTEMDECDTLVYASDFRKNLLEGWEIENANIDNITMCGKEAIIGGYNNFGTGASASITIDLGDGGQGVMVAFTFLKIDSWDSEKAQLYADDVLVWEEVLTYDQGSQLCGSGNSNWHEDKLIREIDLGLMTETEVTLKWTTTLSSAATDESWGIGDLDVYTYDPTCEKIPYLADFAADGDDGWIIVGSDGGTSTCSGMTLLGGYNILDYTDKVSHLVNLPMHTSIQVDFTFVKIDSWDNEKAYFYLDHSEEWTETFAYNAGEQLCGQTNTNWNEDLVEETIVVDHFSPFAWLQWQSGLSGGGTDESWGLADVRVKVTTDSAYTPIYESRFHFKQLDGWVVTNLDSSASGYFTECSDIVIFGGYKTFAYSTTATKLLTHLPKHDHATIAWTWAKIDSWDNEYFYVYADSSQIYSQKAWGSAGDNLCGRTDTNWDEEFFSQYEEIDHTSDELEIKFTTSLSSAGSDESWGLVGVSVYLS